MIDFIKKLFAAPPPQIYGEAQRDLIAGISMPRSRHWAEVRDKFLQDHPRCEVTGSRIDLEVHHIVPFHLVPALELRESNLIVLTREIHFFVGHLCNWKSYNPTCVDDVLAWRKKIEKRP